MLKKPDIQGLCCTCNSCWTCLSLHNSLKRGEPILYCESFDNFGLDKQIAQYDEREHRKKAHSFSPPLNFGI